MWKWDSGIIMANIEIKTCQECKELEEEREYTVDSFELCFKAKCRRNDRELYKFRDWNEVYPVVPEWCPKTKNIVQMDLKVIIGYVILGIKNKRYEAAIALLEDIKDQLPKKDKDEPIEDIDIDSYIIQLRKKSIRGGEW